MSYFLDLSGAVLPRKLVSPNQTFDQYLTISEDHRDEAIITQHPVDSGAVMSDHIYLKPPTVKLRMGWSNADDSANSPTYVIDTYKNLLQLKNARKLFSAYTGKRLYNNMFVASLAVSTDPTKEFSLVADCDLQQLLLVSTKSVSGQPTSTTAGAAANPNANGNPQTNQPTTNTGQNYPTSQPINGGSPAAPAGSPVISGFDVNIPPTQIPPLGTPNDHNGGAGPSQTEEFIEPPP